MRGEVGGVRHTVPDGLPGERRAGLDLDEGRWLLAALGPDVRLGFERFSEYAERRRLTQENLRVASPSETILMVSGVGR